MDLTDGDYDDLAGADLAMITVSDLFALATRSVRDVQAEIEEQVSNANITIIEGIGASQYGIGIASARLAEAVLRDEGSVFPVSAHQPDYDVSLSLPAVLGRS